MSEGAATASALITLALKAIAFPIYLYLMYKIFVSIDASTTVWIMFTVYVFLNLIAAGTATITEVLGDE